ncbi:hypothetical protein IHQ76_08720 [Bifidobacterium dentium]|uniref:hypothetical protein n=1 Tax=Bifidobacterium dentium TaxID=1689 RepID=UPI00080B0C76|nr:hypothetical protein [Bifidobacterium dentium]MBF9696874.1 hypothetical protein [Bifidobacterium dentium]MBF9713033.1 hypothetical protein [Bifidobacterium dentium]MBF9714995.1 hypothetical protein [Bifidobacterium dentium]MBF9718972.1 hypothetical protein [Bifidobacterium dentium]
MVGAMTLPQEEQEQPQVKAGPTRHAKIMRGIVTPILGLLAVACIVLGVLNATMWKPSARITASSSVNGSRYVVTDPGVLSLIDKRVNITAKASDASANVCIVIGSARDVAGWIAGTPYTRITGLSDWSALSTQKAAAQGTADQSDNQVAVQDSDMWTKTSCGNGTANLQIKGTATDDGTNAVALIDFGDAKNATVSLDWTRQTLPDFAMPLYFAGGLFVILAILAASVFAMPPHKRRHRAAAAVAGVGSEQGDSEAVSTWVKNAETSASRNEKASTSKRKRRRHASHRSGARTQEPDDQQPTIIDPAARNLVADQQANAVPSDGGATTDTAGNSDGEATSVISADELQAYFARLAQEQVQSNTDDGADGNDQTEEAK